MESTTAAYGHPGTHQGGLRQQPPPPLHCMTLEIKTSGKSRNKTRMSPPLDLFALASVVELHGLVSTPHHNGRRGVVLRAGGANNERLEVQLEQVSESETPARLAVRPSNVREVPDGDVSLALLRLSSLAWVHSAAFGKRLRKS